MERIASHITKRARTARAASAEGFSLVELMAVVALIAILLMLAVGLFDRSTQKARLEECDANVKTIQIAINRAAAIYEVPKYKVTEAMVDKYITGGIKSLSCTVKKNPQPTYHVVNGVISPAHNHR